MVKPLFVKIRVDLYRIDLPNGDSLHVYNEQIDNLWRAGLFQKHGEGYIPMIKKGVRSLIAAKRTALQNARRFYYEVINALDGDGS